MFYVQAARTPKPAATPRNKPGNKRPSRAGTKRKRDAAEGDNDEEEAFVDLEDDTEAKTEPEN